MHTLLLALLLSPALAQEPVDAPADAPSLIWDAADLPEVEPITYTEVLDDAGEPIPVDELPLTAGPGVITYVEAPYPADAQAAELEGVVKLLLELDEHGRLTHAEVLEPIGHGFDEAALAAVAQMTFSAAQTQAGPVGVAFEFAYGFTFQPPPVNPELPVAPPPVTLEGQLTEMGTRRPIADAKVILDGTEYVATSDEDGHFAFPGVPPGTWHIKVLSPEHVITERDVDVVDGEVTAVDLWLRGLQYRENEAVGVYEAKREEVTRRTLTIDEVKRVPGTFGDPIKVIQTLPGAARSPFGTGMLIIRGANPEDSGVYVDGVRLPIIYHLTGTTSVLLPELIESVDYLPGGYSATYGRSMGGSIDVKTKSKTAEDGLLTWGADILDAQIYYEGRLGKDKQHGIALGARRSYIDAFIPLFMGNASFSLKPRYWDYGVKLLPEVGGRNKLTGFVYGFNDVLRVWSPADVSQGPDQDTQGALSVEYASHRAVVTYEHTFSDRLKFTTTPSIGVDSAITNVGESFKLDNVNTIAELRAELPWQATNAIEIVPGLDAVGGLWRFEFKSPFNLQQAVDPLAEREDVVLDGHGTALSPDAYLKVNLRPFEDEDRLLIAPSLRANYMRLTYAGSVTGGEGVPPWNATSYDPRLTVRGAVSEALVLKGSSGLYHQPPQPFESVGLGTSLNLGYEQAWSSSFGWEHKVTPVVQWDVDLFYRDMTDLITVNDNFTGFGGSPFVNAGVGRAYGAELIVRHLPHNGLFGWASYTLSKSERRDCATCDWYAFDFDQRHIFSAQGGVDLPKDWGFSAQVQYVTGNPSSPSNAGVYDVDTDTYAGFRVGPANSVRLPPFFQTSVRVDRLWTYRKWQLETYVDLLNAVRGVNPEFTQYAYDYSDFAYVRGLPFIPNIGIEGKFFP